MKYLYAITFYFLSCSTFALTTSTYFHNDPLGSPSEQTNHLGDTLWPSPVYKPYGERESFPSIGNTSSIGYTGKIDDADTGLTYMNARYYDPRIGRFLSPDPMTFIDGGPAFFSRYTYAHNNPYAYIDPTGAIPLPVMIGLGALAVMGNNAHYLSGQIPQRQSLKARMQEGLDALPAAIIIGIADRMVPGLTKVIPISAREQFVSTVLKTASGRILPHNLHGFIDGANTLKIADIPAIINLPAFQKVLGKQRADVGHSGSIELSDTVAKRLFGMTSLNDVGNTSLTHFKRDFGFSNHRVIQSKNLENKTVERLFFHN